MASAAETSSVLRGRSSAIGSPGGTPPNPAMAWLDRIRDDDALFSKCLDRAVYQGVGMGHIPSLYEEQTRSILETGVARLVRSPGGGRRLGPFASRGRFPGHQHKRSSAAHRIIVDCG